DYLSRVVEPMFSTIDGVAKIQTFGGQKLANMVPRFLLPTSGQVRIDGIASEELTLRSLRSHISLVSQDVVLSLRLG
ncbi:lipid A exporting ATP-binding/permease ABC transporter, partial [Alcaligenes faecalis subsp. faecalis NCIB 8687]